ncbi:hypothetical protein VP1G_11149 [Cytospora mali]|uniref:Uncharacterized protein n=1 Tax=Cytospora mali TaxID=578113 RepID=A0A194V593_CYTMA|nr:hypothetical protein VP1G_11149 [Valsa mali var. pyri (nom. inval.)]
MSPDQPMKLYLILNLSLGSPATPVLGVFAPGACLSPQICSRNKPIIVYNLGLIQSIYIYKTTPSSPYQGRIRNRKQLSPPAALGAVELRGASEDRLDGLEVSQVPPNTAVPRPAKGPSVDDGKVKVKLLTVEEKGIPRPHR